jgi:hypothetical protein
MSFAALLKKDLRECLPWLLPALIVLLAVGLEETTSHPWEGTWNPYGGQGLWMAPDSPVFATACALFGCTLVLSVVLAVRQFLMPSMSGEWGFLLHPAGRRAVLRSRLTIGLLSLLLLGGVWTGVFLRALRTDVLQVPPPTDVLAVGWVSVGWGCVFYLAVSLSVLSRGTWWGRKTVPLAFALIGLLSALGLGITAAGVIVGIAFALLLPQLLWEFNTREFQG